MLPLELLQILACPVCSGELTQIEDGPSLYCKSCGRDYPIVEGVPILLPNHTVTTS
ncbi:MAG: Trm112 family protein [Desulfuromonadaceae bacterium]|nr:Trm112 family protein [Desulfuromonadaceae bacterium]